MLLVLIFQAALFLGTILGSGTIRQLDDNAFDILRERVISRANYLENEMVQRWSDMDTTPDTLTAIVEQTLAERRLTYADIAADSQLSDDLLGQMSEELIFRLRRNGVTGAFVILNGNGESREYAGLYLRDLDPSNSSRDNSDLLVERAPSRIIKDLEISMDSWWTPRFAFQGDEGAFYDRPLRAAMEHPDIAIEDLGYWCPPFALTAGDMQVITYSLPLRGTDGTVYGVLGVDISLDYLRKLLPYTEIDGEKRGSYLVAIAQGEDLSFQNVLSTGALHKQLFGETPFSAFEQAGEREDQYRAVTENGLDAYGSVHYLQLYNTNTPFIQERWALIGLLDHGTLTASSRHMMRTLLISMFAALVVGSVGILLASTLFTRPVSALVNRVREIDPHRPVSFETVHIAEIDELASAIEALSQNVADSASRLSAIIELAGIPLGAFELQRSAGRVYCTPGFFKLLGMGDAPSGEMDVAQFRSLVESRSNCIEEINPGKTVVIYHINGSGGARWLRLNLVSDANRDLGVLIDVTQETLEKRKIEYERDYDLLTNLLNRRAFHARLGKLFADPRELGIAALIMMDLDNLKHINDTYGHDCGDAYIQCTANALKRYAPPGAALSRMSGDEFMILLYGYADKEALRQDIEKLKQGVRGAALILPNGEPFRIRASAGVAWYPDDSTNYEQLIRYADFAMYKVKHTVKGEFNEFDILSYNREAYLLHGREELNQLIEERLVDYHFQPIVSAADGSILGYEALMRPQHTGLRSPLEVLNLARSQSKLYLIERLTWFRALEACEARRDRLGNRLIFINSIPNQTLSDPDVEQLEQLYPELLRRIVVEITEEERSDESSTQRKHDLARRWLSRLALDDFGAGYSGESTLLALTPDYVKVDMSIVRGIDQDANRQSLFSHFVSYARSCGIQVIAEGVETEAELRTLIELGADYLQGYYLGTPNPQPSQVDSSIVELIRATARQPRAPGAGAGT